MYRISHCMLRSLANQNSVQYTMQTQCTSLCGNKKGASSGGLVLVIPTCGLCPISKETLQSLGKWQHKFFTSHSYSIFHVTIFHKNAYNFISVCLTLFILSVLQGLCDVFIYILQGCFTGTVASHVTIPVPVKQPWKHQNKARYNIGHILWDT